jgi:hypothetical protein
MHSSLIQSMPQFDFKLKQENAMITKFKQEGKTTRTQRARYGKTKSNNAFKIITSGRGGWKQINK